MQVFIFLYGVLGLDSCNALLCTTNLTVYVDILEKSKFFYDISEILQFLSLILFIYKQIYIKMIPLLLYDCLYTTVL